MKKNYLFFMLMTLVILMFSACSDDDNDKGSSPTDVPHSSSEPITLTDLSPITGGLGTRVVVTGNNFGNDKSKVKLFFNEKEALIIDINNQHVYAMVPKQPGDLSTVKVVIDGKEGSLAEKQFAYQIKAVVTTIAGTGEQGTENGSNALEATFKRVAMLDVDNEGNIIVSDDQAKQLRLISTVDNKVKTIGSGTHEVWQSAFSADYENFYVVERRPSQRPLVVRGYNKESNWLEEKFYDGEELTGKTNIYALTADHDHSLYLLSANGKHLVKVDQKTKKMERIGGDLSLEEWIHIAYNPIDHHIYISTERDRTIYRLDPADVPVTREKVEVFAGSPSAGHGYLDANGEDARFGAMEGLCCDKEGNIYVADYGNHVIRKIDLNRNVTTVAGVPGKSGWKDGKPSEALFKMPYDVAVDPNGILYVADTGNNIVRCIAIQ